MTIYVDPLLPRGWILRGRLVHSCHMFTDQLDLGELHALAKAIDCKPEWFQDARRAPHYDLIARRRHDATAAGAVPVSSRHAAEIWQARRAALARASRFCLDCVNHARCDRLMQCALGKS